MRSYLIGLLLFSNVYMSYAQPNSIWYFGEKAGLKFPAGGSDPVVQINGQMLTDEASAVMSDQAGNLLFYTNGEKVYNRKHDLMLNGEGLNGHISSFQGAVIIQQPNSDNLFYIFTTDGFEKGFQKGYQYHIVDMEKDSGYGEVILKNRVLWNPGTERMAAIRHTNGIDYWIVGNANNSNLFLAWKLTCNGIEPAPVTTNAGIILDDYPSINSGCLKASPNGKLLCQTHFPDVEGEADETGFQLLDFDATTGTVSNARLIEFPNIKYFTAEFSNNSIQLYVTRSRDSEIDQFNLLDPSLSAIKNSRNILNAVNSIYGIQTAPNGKIYFNHADSFLSVINFPDQPAAFCGIQLNTVNLGARQSRLGLPATVNDLYFSSNLKFVYEIIDTCSGSVSFKPVINLSGAFTYLWDFGDGTTSTVSEPTHIFDDPQKKYIVKLKLIPEGICGFYEYAQNIIPGGISVNPDFEPIIVCGSNSVEFKNTSDLSIMSGFTYLWNFGDGTTSSEENPTHIFTDDTAYSVTLNIKTGNPCLDRSKTKEIKIRPFDLILEPRETTVNQGEAVPLKAFANAVSFQWSPDKWLTKNSIPNPIAKPFDTIVYNVTVINDQGCQKTDSIKINVLAYNDIYVPGAFTPNEDGKNDIFRPWFDARYDLIQFSVFNRWGQSVFNSSTRGQGWNGKINGVIQDSAIYTWMIILRDENGNKKVKRGATLLIR